MSDRKIITKKELNYIETLYLYCNIERFIDTVKMQGYSISPDISPSEQYYIVMSYYKQYLDDNAEYLNFAKGRDWYRLNNYRIGIMDYDLAKKANQFNCVIQYEWHHLYNLDRGLTGLDLPFSEDRSKYHIKRIDITKIAKVKEDYTKHYGYISPYRRLDYVNGTVYLGNRKNGNVFRMYNKTRELLSPDQGNVNYLKIDILSEYFGNVDDLYTYELELHRAHLKDVLNIQTLEQLPRVYKAYQNIVGGIRFYKDTDKNRRLVEQGHRDRIDCWRLTDYVEYKRVEKKRYKPSFEYATEKIVKVADNYIDSMGLDRNNANYMMFINELISKRINQKNKDMIIDFEDNEFSLDMEKMRTKHILMRDNQDNKLEREAKVYIGGIKNAS